MLGVADEHKKISPSSPSLECLAGTFHYRIGYLTGTFYGMVFSTKGPGVPAWFFSVCGYWFGGKYFIPDSNCVFLRLIKRSYKDLGLGTFARSHLLFGLLVGLFLFLVVGSLENILEKYWDITSPRSFTLVLLKAGYTWQLPILLVLGGIAIPLKDEILFRGLLYPALRRVFGRGIGIIFSGVVFAFMQFNIIGFFPFFIEGVVLSWLYERSSSLWPSIIAHSTWNILVAVLLWIQT